MCMDVKEETGREDRANGKHDNDKRKEKKAVKKKMNVNY